MTKFNPLGGKRKRKILNFMGIKNPVKMVTEVTDFPVNGDLYSYTERYSDGSSWGYVYQNFNC